MAREMYLVGVSEEELGHPKPPEEPKTPRGKWENFWFYQKWKVIVITCAVLLITFVTVEALTRTRPDYKLLIVTDTYIDDAVQNAMEIQLEAYGKDLNGDGKIYVSIENLCVSTTNPQSATNRQKVVVNVSAGDVMLFAVTPTYYKETMCTVVGKDKTFFDTLGVTGTGVSEDGTYWNWKDDALFTKLDAKDKAPQDLYFGVRQLTGSAASSKKQYEQSMALLRAYITKQPLTKAVA